jgi:penicillin-binding protein 2
MARRLVVLRATVVLLCLLVLGRLVQLQVIEGNRNRELADENRIRVIRRLAPRGNIYDRRDRLLAGSRLAFSVCVVPDEVHVTGADDTAAALAQLLSMPADEVRKTLEGSGAARFEAAFLLREASPEVVARLEEHSIYTSGVSVLADAVRHYPHGALAAHVLGYVREVSGEELARPENAGYRPLDLIGKDGVEKVAEQALKGIDGGDQIEVDARGRRVRTLGTMAPQSGRSVWLTLDLDVQQAAEEALGGRAGAVVAMDPWTGEVLAMASGPSYDPNVFVGALSPEEWRRLSGPGHPQQNRATTSHYPPGSLFKLVTAAAALEAHEVSPEDRFHCSGAFRIGSWTLRCWKRSGHGDLDFTRGFAQSCNVMFSTLGRRTGPERLAEMARRFGLGARSGIDLPEEAAGLIPDPEWKRKKRSQPWYPGDTCQLAVGQGDCLVTPLQMAREVAVIANGGKLVTPRVILRVEGEDTAVRGKRQRSVGLEPETIEAIRAGMRAVVAPGGTASRIATDRYAIAGKTGTAQAPGGQPHAWFGGYAPADDPKLVVVVVVEHGGSGSAAAAPIARHVMDAALLPEKERPPWHAPGPPAQISPRPAEQPR